MTDTTELVVPRSMPMILEAMSTPVECEKAMAGLPICRTTAVGRRGVQLAYPAKLPKWLI
jgi:hypothetical protein